ncbi:uncharacterized protein LOC129735525 [Falco cherrug]|uniref:uncharacterized protein LOC129735525 n=1 Tax=Falco cherrug TaxID=345164 RepID=UPI00247AC64C|nr:uncharacterized protein LOC129735525 [Falco cherrug]
MLHVWAASYIQDSTRSGLHKRTVNERLSISLAVREDPIHTELTSKHFLCYLCPEPSSRGTWEQRAHNCITNPRLQMKDQGAAEGKLLVRTNKREPAMKNEHDGSNSSSLWGENKSIYLNWGKSTAEGKKEGTQQDMEPLT